MFNFKQFSINDARCAMKIGTDGVLLGAWAFENFIPETILDVGTGSGLISLMMAQRFSTASITGIEMDRDASLDAADNASRSPWQSRISVLNEDFMSLDTTCKFDAIVSNPPFYDENVRPIDSKRDIARHESAMSLKSLISRSSGLLTPHGHIALIAPADRLEELIYILTLNRLDPCRVCLVRHNPTTTPLRVMIEAVKGLATTYTRSELILKNGSRYTQQYQDLTSDFYLDSTFE